VLVQYSFPLSVVRHQSFGLVRTKSGLGRETTTALGLIDNISFGVIAQNRSFLTTQTSRYRVRDTCLTLVGPSAVVGFDSVTSYSQPDLELSARSTRFFERRAPYSVSIVEKRATLLSVRSLIFRSPGASDNSANLFSSFTGRARN